MSINRTLIPQFKKLPIEVVHLICLFTGKFVFDKYGNFKSIINIEDFKNIQTLMLIHDSHLNKYSFRWFTMNHKIRFIQKLYSDRLLDKKERVKEEVLSVQKVDYAKQSYLFIKPSTIEEVMIPNNAPVDPNEFCDKCFAQMLFPNTYTYHVNTIVPNMEFRRIMVWEKFKYGSLNTKKLKSCDNPNYCDKCNNALVPTYPKRNKKMDQKSIKQITNTRLMKKQPVIKNFHRLN